MTHQAFQEISSSVRSIILALLPLPQPSYLRCGNGRILASASLTSRSCRAASLSSSLRTWRMAALHASQSTSSSTSFPGLIRCPIGLALICLRNAFRNFSSVAPGLAWISLIKRALVLLSQQVPQLRHRARGKSVGQQVPQLRHRARGKSVG